MKKESLNQETLIQDKILEIRKRSLEKNAPVVQKLGEKYLCLEAEKVEKHNLLNDLKLKIDAQEEDKIELGDKIESLQKHIDILNQEIFDTNIKYNLNLLDIESLDNAILDLDKNVEESNNYVNKARHDLGAVTQKLICNRGVLSSKNEDLENSEAILKQLIDSLNENNNSIKSIIIEIEKVSNRVKEIDRSLISTKTEKESTDELIASNCVWLEELRQNVQYLEEELNILISSKDQSVNVLSKINSELDGLTNKEQALITIKNSKNSLEAKYFDLDVVVDLLETSFFDSSTVEQINLLTSLANDTFITLDRLLGDKDVRSLICIKSNQGRISFDITLSISSGILTSLLKNELLPFLNDQIRESNYDGLSLKYKVQLADSTSVKKLGINLSIDSKLLSRVVEL